MSALAFLYPEQLPERSVPDAGSDGARPGGEGREVRRRRFLEAALLAQPPRETPVFRPYAGSGFAQAVQAREERFRGSAV